MLKKITKFGNSNALVLDRTIMALLNLEESSYVKLRVEGEKLIVSLPEHAVSADEKVQASIDRVRDSYTQAIDDSSDELQIKNLKSLAGNLEVENKKWQKKIKNDPKMKVQQDEWYEDSNNEATLESEFLKTHAKYTNLMKQVCSNSELQKVLASLLEKHKDNLSSKEHLDEQQKLYGKFIPDFKKYQDELKMVGEKFGPKLDGLGK